MTEQDYEKRRKDCTVFNGTDSINGMLNYDLQNQTRS